VTAGVTPIRPLVPIVALLKGDAGLDALTAGRIYGVEIDEADLGPDKTPARKVIVCRLNGAVSNASVPFTEYRVSLRCYGESWIEAYRVWSTVADFLKVARPARVGSAYFQRARPGTGPFEYVDPDLEWPYLIGEWQVLLNDREI
jgi:hypothetical protein